MRSSLLAKATRLSARHRSCRFSTSSRLDIIKPFYLADIGEGIRECEVIQWFVEPGAHIEEFDKICEVQSDKASVDIPSRFSGVIKKLHYEAGEMAIVGKPLIDIDVEEDVVEDSDPVLAKPPPEKEADIASNTPDGFMAPKGQSDTVPTESKKKGTHASLATPAVRHLSKELNVDINTIHGTGRDGRVTKEDIYNHQETTNSKPSPSEANATTPISSPTASTTTQQETIQALTKVQTQMFKTMTRSLQIPHFVYSDDVDLTNLSALRTRLNSKATKAKPPHPKLSYLPFIIKALSQTLHTHPLLNAKLHLPPTDNPSPPHLIYRTHHNIGIAMDTPSGLIVPVIHNVADLSILSIAQRLATLQTRAASNTLLPSDLIGGTITLSNIGSIGGHHFSPVLVEGQVAILALGRLKDVPAFGDDGGLVRRRIMGFSWGADHRVLDGAGVARANEYLRGLLEDVESLLVGLR